MISPAIMDQIVREAAMGIGDILNAFASRTAGGYVPRADRPDLLVVDPAVEPVFHPAVLLAAELGIVLPKVVMIPDAGLLELVKARAWSRSVDPDPLIDASPLAWLTAAGCDATRAFLTELVAAHAQGSLRLLAVGGTYDSELPYMASPDEQIPIGDSSVRIAAVYLTPNYYPEEDGPLDLAALAAHATMYRRDVILARIKPL